MLTGLLRFVAKVLVREDWRIVQDRIIFELRQITRGEEFSPSLAAQLLLVSGEDHRHRRHYGFDPYAICRSENTLTSIFVQYLSICLGVLWRQSNNLGLIIRLEKFCQLAISNASSGTKT